MVIAEDQKARGITDENDIQASFFRKSVQIAHKQRVDASMNAVTEYAS
jgi:hypothetical protein